MQIMVIFALVIAALAILFAVQNNTPVQVSFLAWKVESPLALVLLIAVAAGALISLLASLPTITRDKLSVRAHRKKVAELESSLSDHKGKLEETQKKLAGQEAEKELEKVDDPAAKKENE
jgi:lipopolysaccharide assembly protein A